MVPPDPIPNSEVKRRNADGSVGLPHVRVGHRQVDMKGTPVRRPGFFIGEKSQKGERQTAPNAVLKPKDKTSENNYFFRFARG